MVVALELEFWLDGCCMGGAAAVASERTDMRLLRVGADEEGEDDAAFDRIALVAEGTMTAMQASPVKNLDQVTKHAG